MTRARQRWTLVATILGSAMTFIDGTVVNVALPALQTDLQATITDVQWVVASYSLFLSALLLLGGSLGDQFGRKRVFLIGVGVFTGASVLCGLASSPRLLIGARALQGVGAAFLVPGSLAIINATFDGAERGRAIGTWSGFSAITTAIGPVLGGWLIERISWRAAFFLNVPLAAAVIVLSVAFMNESKDSSRGKGIDWIGGALAVLGLGGLSLGLIEWPALGARHPMVVASLLLGVTMLVALVIVEGRGQSPMMPLKVFRSRAFSLANALTLLLYAALGMVMFLVPLVLIQVQHYTATQAGAAIVPFAVIMFAGSRWAGGLIGRVGPRLPLTIGPAVAAVGIAMFAMTRVGGSYWSAVFPAVCLMGAGMTITVAPLTTTVMGAVETAQSGVASGINNAVSRVAGLLAIAVFGVLLASSFNARIQPRLSELRLPAAARQQVERELPKMAGAELRSTEMSETQRRVVQKRLDQAFVEAFRIVMLGCAALALAAAGFGAAIRQPARRARAT
ncbi:MAG TPA: MFS transporter [Gemmatimonadaceae bacterium]|nr:MFS transporter [Gemmatimonadaceae bacterium]